MHQILIYIPRLDFKDLINLWPFTNKHLLCDVYVIMSHKSQQKEYFENLYCKDLSYYIYYISLSSLRNGKAALQPCRSLTVSLCTMSRYRGSEAKL